MSRERGDKAEGLACRFLAARGVKIVARNYRTRRGEIDIIGVEGNIWLCIEVKFRRQAAHGYAAEMVSAQKLARMRAAFAQYLMDNKLNPEMTPQRVDVVACDDNAIKWLKNVACTTW